MWSHTQLTDRTIFFAIVQLNCSATWTEWEPVCMWQLWNLCNLWRNDDIRVARRTLSLTIGPWCNSAIRSALRAKEWNKKLGIILNEECIKVFRIHITTKPCFNDHYSVHGGSYFDVCANVMMQPLFWICTRTTLHVCKCRTLATGLWIHERLTVVESACTVVLERFARTQ